MIPLIYSWAITIHKCQGMTLDKAVIELDCFDHHMEYVALSRLRTLDGLAISYINHQRFINNNIVYQPAFNEIYKRTS